MHKKGIISSINFKFIIFLLLIDFILIYSFFKDKNSNLKFIKKPDKYIPEERLNENKKLNLSYLEKQNIYKYFRFPIISIIIQMKDKTLEKKVIKDLKEFIDFNYLKLGDFEIIFSISYNNSELINFIKSIRDNKYLVVSRNPNKNFTVFNLILFAKGKYITILKDIFLINRKFIHNINSLTNGNTKYVYKLNEKKPIYIIKTKIARDIYDDGVILKDFDDLINYALTLPKPNYNNIYIAFCLDNKYIMEAYIAVISILENKNINTYIYFYFLISKDLTENNKNLFVNLYEQYDLFNLTFLNIDDRFNKVKTFRYISKIAYFKLTLCDFLPNLNKIIYLDSDIIVYKDLYNLYDHNFNGKLILAVPVANYFKLSNKSLNYNSGVLLLNLKKMREIKFSEKVEKIINKGFMDNIYHLHDQALLNMYFYDYIGFLSPEYNSKIDIFDSNSKFYLKTGDFFNFTKLLYSEKHPTIYHFTGDKKPFEHKRKNGDDWWFFFRKSKYFENYLKDRLKSK